MGYKALRFPRIARYEIIMCVCDCVVRRPEDKSKPLSNKLPNGEPSALAVVPAVALPAGLARLMCARSSGGALGIPGQPKERPMPMPDAPRSAWPTGNDVGQRDLTINFVAAVPPE